MIVSRVEVISSAIYYKSEDLLKALQNMGCVFVIFIIKWVLQKQVTRMMQEVRNQQS